MRKTVKKDFSQPLKVFEDRCNAIKCVLIDAANNLDGQIKRFEQDEIDATIERHSNGWKVARLTRVSRAVIRLCVYEMANATDVPATVAINEAIELSKKYDDEKARSFVNGVLNGIKAEYDAK